MRNWSKLKRCVNIGNENKHDRRRWSWCWQNHSSILYLVTITMRLANTKRHKKMWQSPRLPPFIYLSFPFNFGKNPPFLKFESEKWTDIITPSPTNAQRCFLLLRANQLSFIIEGNRFFDEKASLQTLVDQLVGAKPRKMPRGEPLKKKFPAKIQTRTLKLLPARLGDFCRAISWLKYLI